MNNTTEPAALAGIEPVAWYDSSARRQCIYWPEDKPAHNGEWQPLYSAATVERLAQERDDFEQARDYFEKMNVMHFNQLLACQQERDELTVFQGMFNDMLLVEVELREQLAAVTKERDMARDHANRLGEQLGAEARISDEQLAACQQERDKYRSALEEARQAFLTDGEQILKDFYSEYNNRLGMSIDFKECYAAQITEALAKYPREEK